MAQFDRARGRSPSGLSKLKPRACTQVDHKHAINEYFSIFWPLIRYIAGPYSLIRMLHFLSYIHVKTFMLSQSTKSEMEANPRANKRVSTRAIVKA